MKKLDASTQLDLFDYRYGKNGAILYREGVTSPETAVIDDDEEEKQEMLGKYCVEVSSKYFDSLNGKLKKVANKSLKKLAKENPGLLIFPDNPKDLEEDIQKDCVLETEDFGDRIRVSTYNLIGFIGCDDLKINIHSRFEEKKLNGEDKKITDFFLIYMLEKISRLNLLDLPSPSRDDINIFDLLPYLFPQYLKRALAQGMYKEYVRKLYNDSNIKGTIDVSRHIRSNIPFLGKVAYNTREFSLDNRITQLIRHTIEHLRNYSLIGERILNSPDVHDMVRQIIDATPTYSAMDRQKVIMDNLKTFAHPYYNEYAPLQKLCLAILRYDQLSYGDSDQDVHGVIFDIAALWEEYLAVVLQDLDIVHPNNRETTNPQYIFEGITNAYERYPDFFRKDKSCVMDAKYKRIADNGHHIERNDIHQLITYMYIMQAPKGMIISPAVADDLSHWKDIGTLNGYGGIVQIYYMRIPESNDYTSFCKAMKTEEWLLRNRLTCE